MFLMKWAHSYCNCSWKCLGRRWFVNRMRRMWNETASKYFFVSWTRECVRRRKPELRISLLAAKIETKYGFLIFRARFCFWVNNHSVDVWLFLQLDVVWVECFVYNCGQQLYGHRVLQIFSISSDWGCCASSSILLIARRLVNFIRLTV